jgi:hypothetical protein
MNDIEYLLGKYFSENNTFSEETSSHWKKYGEKQRIKMVSASPAQQLRSNRERENLLPNYKLLAKGSEILKS